MKAVILLCAAAIFLTACVSKPTKEMLEVRAVNNTDKCQFIKMQYLETAPYNTSTYIQKSVVRNNGDSYKMISSTPISILSQNDAVGSNFEIYKCRNNEGA
ncbi:MULTISPECIES: hypothetical protein [unclassified Marinobacter]|jgi:PBP1b-binding outer membrane lipoprotein LpoB|uniref:hypothetical protein n=1 Tax=unclassified Marinobacter TaxID=83889 RepID=UPI00200FDBEE|nr:MULTISPECIES: hypothetical protein [unclassified Marinobacter]MCL1476970.1 hypothetical protein [Marinobacter sp.]MCL1483398.1 hypothetical protein [Marinobacter sp.]MCL1487694.1 hypothetical protein [Marinobacter sp.]UQG57517.1 hypothetical protein MIH16_07730 [Marinobacter sp. M4C]UQG66322.1 hypothetical protein MIH17_07730 [Marinobacter sp. M2C]